YTTTAEWQAPDTEDVYTITIELADSGSFMCGGREYVSADLDIQVTTVINEPPVVSSLSADPAQVFPGQTSELACTATDADGDDSLIDYTWDTDLGIVTPGAGGAAQFISSAVGIANVTCTATDPDGGLGSDTIGISVTGALPEKSIHAGIVAPQRLAVDSTGNLYVVDSSTGGITVVNLFSGELVYRLAMSGVTSVAVDWADNLMVGTTSGARVVDRTGSMVMNLEASGAGVAAVAVDLVNLRYGTLAGRSGRVTVYDAAGTRIGAFGSTGDGADQFKGPQGLAVTPSGEWVVADTGHGLIKIFDTGGNLLASFGELGGGAGEFVQLSDVVVAGSGIIYASDSFQSWVQAFAPDGTPREALGTYGGELGELKTPTGLAVLDGYDRVVVASLNSSSLQVFITDPVPVADGPSSGAQLSSDALAFDEQAVGTRSAAQAVTLTNTGESLLGVRGITRQGDFSFEHECGLFLEPGDSCDLSIAFSPIAAGQRDGALVIDTSADEIAVDLSGVGVDLPGITLTPSSLVFADQVAGTVSETQIVTLTNLTSAPLVISGIAADGDFVESHDCGDSLPGKGSCTIAVAFAPATVAELLLGSLTVASNAVGSPHSVALSGRGVPPAISIGDVTVEEGDGDEVEAIFDVTLSGPSNGTVAVDFTTAAETAEVDVDFTAVSGTLEFVDGETQQIIAVPILGDEILESDEETFVVELSNPVSSTIEVSSAVGTILDDEVCASPNLLRNPGAEEPTDGDGIPGWTAVQGANWQARSSNPKPFSGEAYFFAGEAETAELEQIVDLSLFADAIASGEQAFVFEGYVRTRREPLPDTGRFLVDYLHQSTGAVLATFDSGQVTSLNKWHRIVDLRATPVETGWIRVRLLASRLTGDTADVYFDALSLRAVRAPTLTIDDLADYEGDYGAHDALFTVELSCAIDRQVSLSFETFDGTATAGEDYLGDSGSLELSSGTAVESIPVTIFGDEIDEDHESFFLQVSNVLPEDLIVLDSRGLGVIVNDDFCPQHAFFWKQHPWLWSEDELEIGGRVYAQQELLELLAYTADDDRAQVARELVAAKLNLLVGSPPDILEVVAAADRYLARQSEGIRSELQLGQQGFELRISLHEYNNQGCDQGYQAILDLLSRRFGGRRVRQ
ncbi:MAG: Calx-beta domain-containing protein, partial [Thermoanaerobaculia bacterium]